MNDKIWEQDRRRITVSFSGGTCLVLEKRAFAISHIIFVGPLFGIKGMNAMVEMGIGKRSK